MRSADAATLFRVLLVVLVAYLILSKFNPIIITVIIGVAIALDALDGFLAIRESSRGRLGLCTYVSALSGNEKSKSVVSKFKAGLKSSKSSRFGPRIDVAGDRAAEYILWVTYAFAGVIPLFVLFIVIIRHSFVDAVMAAKGTSSKMKTRFAQIIYSSNLWRGGINVVKFLTFSYLAFVYSWGYPVIIGYAFVTILVAYILLRGAAELYEAYA